MSAFRKLIAHLGIFLFMIHLCFGAEEGKQQNIKETIASLNSLQSKHLTLLNGNDHPRKLAEGEKIFSEPWCNKIGDLSTVLVKHLKVDESIFDYPGILGCGRIVTRKTGYILEMYARTRGIGDTAGISVVRHILHISNKGVIQSIGRSIPFPD